MGRAVLTSSMTFRFEVLPLLGVVLTLGLLIWVALGGLNASTILFLDDQAFSMMLGELVRNGTMPLLGLPSHLGGRHVGPFYLWIMGLVVTLADGDPVTVTKLLTMMKVGAVLLLSAFSYWICSINRLPKLLSLNVILLVSCCGVYSWVLRVDWANNFLLVPSVFALYATYLFFERGVGAISLCAVAWSILLQTHLSAAPFIAGMGLVCIGRLIYRRNLPTETKHSVLLQALVWIIFVGLWIPPLYYEIQYQSNIGSLFFAHTIDSSREAGFLMALMSFGTFLRSLIVPFVGNEQKNLQHLMLAGLVALMMVGLLRDAKNYSVGTRWFFLSVLVGIFFMVLAASRVQPPIHEYYFYVLLPVWPLVSGIAVSSLYRQYCESTSSFTLLVGLVCCGLGLFMLSWKGRYGGGDLPVWHTLRHAQELFPLISQIEKEADQKGGIPVFFRKSDLLRANTVYHFLGPERFHFMQFSGKLAEFKGAQVMSRARYVRRVADWAVFIACPRHPKVRKDRQFKRMGVVWSVERPIETSSCVSCSACDVTLMRREHAVLKLE